MPARPLVRMASRLVGPLAAALLAAPLPALAWFPRSSELVEPTAAGGDVAERVDLATFDAGPEVGRLRPDGPERAVLDLWRARPGADKVLVMAGLPDGSEALFVIDTGAALSVLDADTARRLGLEVRRLPARVGGLSGDVPWDAAVLPSVTLGGHVVEGVRVAVGVAGVPKTSGPLPIAGILGMNVWSAFTTIVDYPRDRLELWRPDARTLPTRVGTELVGPPLQPRVAVTLRARDRTLATIPLDVDTGARDVILLGSVGEPFLESSTRGEEPVLGIGASPDELPPEAFLAVTRRVPLREVRLGRTRLALQDDARARWLSPESPIDRPGLFGHAPMARRRLVIDTAAGRLALLRPTGLPRTFDAVEAMRARLASAGPSTALARLLAAQDEIAEAISMLRAVLASTADDADAAEILAALLRHEGDTVGATAAEAALPVTTLVDARLWIGHVNARALDGDRTGALDAARTAHSAGTAGSTDPDAATRTLAAAYADVLAHAGDPREATAVLHRAVGTGTSQHLLRRARYAALAGDRTTAIVHLRARLRAWPLDGTPLLIYARLVEASAQGARDTFRADLDALLARLHPEDAPLDFAGAALRHIGDEARGQELLERGRRRDCAPLRGGPSRDNCEAWYLALSGRDLPRATALVARALARNPHAYAYHDTAAVIALARGDQPTARTHALAAARLSPADPSLHWQLDRADGKLP